MPGYLRFVFNVLHFKSGEGRTSDREGVCTGWLNTITEHLQRQPLEQKGYDELESDSTSSNDLLKVIISSYACVIFKFTVTVQGCISSLFGVA